jgi:hypothetical protein
MHEALRRWPLLAVTAVARRCPRGCQLKRVAVVFVLSLCLVAGCGQSGSPNRALSDHSIRPTVGGCQSDCFQAGDAASSNPPVPAGATASCQPDVFAGPNTSCALALQVREVYLAQVHYGAGTVKTVDPLTGKAYVLHCTGQSPTVCHGEPNALVEFYA